MSYLGIVIHHSACSSINGKGYDYFISKNGSIIPAQEQTDPEYLHLCMEGDFSVKGLEPEDQVKEQLFLLEKLIIRLSLIYDLKLDAIYSHDKNCPGGFFPWAKLVILPEDLYH